VKFRADNRWDINWGNSFFPNGIAIQNGANIPIPAEGKYNITFNDITGEYTFTIVSRGKP
jgi:hypothetical protein